MAVRQAISSHGDEVEQGSAIVRAETLEVLLAAVGLLMWLLTVPFLADPTAFWPGWGEPVAVIAVVAVCLVVRRRSHHFAAALLVAALTGVVTARLLTAAGDSALLPFLYVPVVLLAGALFHARSALLVAALASGAIVLRAPLLGQALPLTAATIQALATIWLTAVTAWLTSRSLFTTLSWFAQSQEEAAANLAEARRQRGEAVSALQQLEAATYRLERMNYALHWARLEAEQARRLKAQFAAHVSHELRTPINLITGFSDMMLNVPSAYGARLPASYQTDLQTLHRNAKHLQGLIDDILDLSQLDAHEMPVMRESVEVAAVVGEAVGAIRQLLERKGLSIDVDVAPDVSTAYLDPLRIRQVLLNLLSNAARHTQTGGITIRCHRHGEEVAIAVTDTGQGIDPREIPHLFGAFHRIGSTGVHEGWGLGLAICKQFVELHGGSITAQSDGIPGHGTTFTITLPIHPQSTEAPSVPGALRRATGALVAAQTPASVVVLDPDPDVVRLLQRHLPDYRVDGAATEPEALELARSIAAHALVVGLPEPNERDGWHRHWSAVAARHQVRIVACALPSRREAISASGLAERLVKPVTRERLIDAFRRVRPDARMVAIVDDDPAMVRLLGRMLRAANRRLRIVRAYDGEEGLDLLRRARPDLVLLDIVMPRAGGLALLDAMRADPELAGTPVIAVSANDIPDAPETANGRELVLIADKGLTTTTTIRGVRDLLSFLPPAQTGGSPPRAAPEAAPAA